MSSLERCCALCTVPPASRPQRNMPRLLPRSWYAGRRLRARCVRCGFVTLYFSFVTITTLLVFMLCRRRHNMKEKRILRGHLALRQGTASHRRELKGVLSPKWLLIMAALLASPSPSLASQASGTRGCRDEVSCDGRCRETGASEASRRDSALRYNYLEAAGTRDRR